MITDDLQRFGVIPVVSIEFEEHAVPLAEALREGGLNLAEVTFRTETAAACIRAISKAFPDFIVGAGTLIHPDMVDAAIDAGARFGVAPGVNPAVIRRAQSKDFPYFPGVCTPTDIETALSQGCKIMKFFPAESFGGLKTLKALHAPYDHLGVKFIPTGGMKLATAPDYLAHPSVLAVGGSWIAPSDFIRAEDWSEISERAQSAAHRMKHIDRD